MKSKISLPKIGLGCMGMSEFYGQPNDENSIDILQKSYDLGYRHFDTSDMYGSGHNEELIGRFIKNRSVERQDMIIASKFGIQRDPNNPYELLINGSKDYVKKACEQSLKRLGVDHIDLYYVHRRDINTPIEETVAALSDLVKEGKIGEIGLSEVSAETLITANSVHKISALQSEYSLWSRDVEEEILPLCRDLDIDFVCYSPLGRGFLSGSITKDYFDNTASKDDFRRKLPRFQDSNFDANLSLFEKLKPISDSLGITTAQLSLAWLLAQGENIHVIPGTRTPKYLLDNFESSEIILPLSIVNEISSIFNISKIAGQRYPEAILAGTNL